MTESEFKIWIRDFSIRFPDTAIWLRNLPPDTLSTWHADFFSSSTVELRDAMAANLALMSDPDFQFQKRERLPAIMSKKMREISFARAERIRKNQERKTRGRSRFDRTHDGEHIESAVRLNGDMRRCLDALREFCRQYREETGEKPPTQLCNEFVNDWYDKHVPVKV